MCDVCESPCDVCEGPREACEILYEVDECEGLYYVRCECLRVCEGLCDV